MRFVAKRVSSKDNEIDEKVYDLELSPATLEAAHTYAQADVDEQNRERRHAKKDEPLLHLLEVQLIPEKRKRAGNG